MIIVADENIPYVEDAFSRIGEVRLMAGRSMTPDTVKDADILLVRSVTKVNAPMIDKSRIQFVATATIGEDHIDRNYLQQIGITFASAPGSNADSVAQYITAALLENFHAFDLDPHSTTIGIVGAGNVGSRVLKIAQALGMHCILNDPPLARLTGDPCYRPIEDIYSCDIITLHTPLTYAGQDKTYHMVDTSFISRLKQGCILLNTSRGRVIEETALRSALDAHHLKGCVLDVWESEPDVDTGTLAGAFLATPHIAGYSFDGKVNGTQMIYEAACMFLSITPDWNPIPLLPHPDVPLVEIDGTLSPVQAVRQAVQAVYDIHRDDATMREILKLEEQERPTRFDQLRKTYPRRREFRWTKVRVYPHNQEIDSILRGIGFHVEST